MKTIWKYELSPSLTSYLMPSGAKILTAREQGNKICVWALVDPDEGRVDTRNIAVFGTGHTIPDVPMNYLGTAHLEGGALVFHVFEIIGESKQEGEQ